MNKLSDIYKKPVFACIFCVIYTALSFGLALFGKWAFKTNLSTPLKINAWYWRTNLPGLGGNLKSTLHSPGGGPSPGVFALRLILIQVGRNSRFSKGVLPWPQNCSFTRVWRCSRGFLISALRSLFLLNLPQSPSERVCLLRVIVRETLSSSTTQTA